MTDWWMRTSYAVMTLAALFAIGFDPGAWAILRRTGIQADRQPLYLSGRNEVRFRPAQLEHGS